MKITFLGVGDAFEPKLGNASYLISTKSQMLLIDCGYAIPERFFALVPDPDALDSIYVTHFHADHTFGLPSVLARAWEEGRTKPLTIVGQPGVASFVKKLLDLAYPSLRERFQYEIRFEETTQACTLNGCSFTFAETKHSIRNFAVLIEHDGKSAGFSGDGELTAASKELFSNAHLLVHEAFKLDEIVGGHGTVSRLIEETKEFSQLKSLALVHIYRKERARIKDELNELQKQAATRLLVPEPGDVITL